MDYFSSDTQYIEGECMTMCPEEEIKLRQKENLIHILELVPSTVYSRNKIVDPSRMVKCFSRSAAGKLNNNPDNLRPPVVLLRTVSYLLFDVINVDYVPWHIVCDFITDRLMAVRQDMVIQNLPRAETVALLQPIVRFHAYAGYRLCNEPMHNFDSVLNNKHLLECLKKLLSVFDSYDIIQINDRIDISIPRYDPLIETRPEFESLYIIFNIGNDEALRRSLRIPPQYKTEIVEIAEEISSCFKNGHFVRMCRLIKNLPALLAVTAALHLPIIRKQALGIMSVAYNSKNCGFLLKDLREILLYDSEEELKQDCRYYGVELSDDFAYFNKQSFDIEKEVRCLKHEKFAYEKLKNESVQYILMPDVLTADN